MRTLFRYIALVFAGGSFTFNVITQGLTATDVALLLVVVGAVAIELAALRRPGARWVQVVYGSFAGPRTDVANMTRAELFRSAASFITWFLTMCSITLISFHFAIQRGIEAAPLVFGVAFVSSMLTLMALAGSLYMLVRAVLRSPDYVPPSNFDEQK